MGIFNVQSKNPIWRNLYRAGGIVPIIVVFFYLAELLSMASGEPYPTNVESWFSLFQRDRILGLLYLNAFDVFSIALLGVTFLALYVSLKQFNESYAAIAGVFAFIGIPSFITPRVLMLSIISLSNQYAASASDAQRSQILAAGQGLSSLGTATPQTVGFFFLAIAVLILSVIMLRSTPFWKVTAYMGILNALLTFLDDIVAFTVSSIATYFLLISSFSWFIWFILTSRKLLQLSRSK